MKRFKISSLPAVVGKMSNGEEHVLKAGIGVKDLSSGIEEMKGLLIKFEQMNKKAASDWRKESSQYEEQDDIGIPILTSLNVEGICSETTPLCIVGAFGSTKVKEKMKLIFSQASSLSHTLSTYKCQSVTCVDHTIYSRICLSNAYIYTQCKS